MSEIFARVGVGQPVPGLRRPPAVPALRPSRGSGPSVTLLTAAVAGLVGLCAGAFVIRTPGPAAPAAVKVAIQPQLRSPAPGAAPIALAQAAPPPAVTAVPAASAKPAEAGKASSRPVRTVSRSRAQFRAKLARLDESRPAEARPPIRLREPTPVAQPASCLQDAAGDDCRVAVIQADRHLRSVYQNAIRRGVPRDVLEDYRDRWADLREQQNEEPTRLIESYGALAYDLGREAADDQDDAPRPKGRSGLRALADLLLPWR